MPERVDEERRRAPLLERLGVPVVELVDDVGVRRRELWYCEGYWGYCEFMGEAVVGEAGTGKTPEEVVRVREWPICASLYCGCAGRTAIPGLAMGLRRTGNGTAPPYDGTCEGWAITAVCMFALASLDDHKR